MLTTARSNNQKFHLEPLLRIILLNYITIVRFILMISAKVSHFQ